MGYGMRDGREEEQCRRDTKLAHSSLAFFRGESPFQRPRKTITDFVLFLYSVMFSEDEILTVYKPNPT